MRRKKKKKKKMDFPSTKREEGNRRQIELVDWTDWNSEKEIKGVRFGHPPLPYHAKCRIQLLHTSPGHIHSRLMSTPNSIREDTFDSKCMSVVSLQRELFDFNPSAAS